MFVHPISIFCLALSKSAREKLKTVLIKLETEIDEKRQTEPKLNVRSGPVSGNIEQVLKKHKIIQQAYHSRSFVGNHCAKYIKPEIISELCSSMKGKVKSISRNPNTHKEAAKISYLIEYNDGLPINPDFMFCILYWISHLKG